MPSRTPRRGALGPFFFLTAALTAGHGVLLTVLDDYRSIYGISEGALGVVVGLGFFTSFLAAVTIAPLADRGFSRRLVVVGLTLDVAGLVLTAVSSSFAALAAGRFITGLGTGMAVPAIRRIVVVAEPQRLGHNLGRLLAFDVAGLALGPVVSAVLVGPLGLGAPFLVVAGITLVLSPVVLRTHVHEETGSTSTERFAWSLLRNRAYASAVLLGCTVFLMIGFFDSLWALALSDLGASKWLISLGVTMFALPLIVLGSLGGRLAQQVGPWRLGTWGLLAASGFLMTYGYAPGAVAMFVIVMVHSVTDGLTISSAGVAVGLSAPPERQAAAQGLLSGLQTLTAGAAAVAAGTLYEQFGRATAYTVAALLMATMVVSARVLVRGTPYATMHRAAVPVGAEER
jgi:MFS family permease